MSTLRSASACVAVTAIAAALSVPPGPAWHAPHDSAGGLLLSRRMAAFGTPPPLAQNDPTGQSGSGPRAVAYRPSGRRAPKASRRHAPDARLFQTGANAVEPTMGITRKGTLFFIGVEGDKWPIFATKTVRSDDGGVTWTDVTPGASGQSDHPYTEDPYLYVDRATGRVFTTDFLLPCTELSYSDDGGVMWTTTIMGCDLADHQTLFSGPPVSSPTPAYPNVLYYCAIDGGAAAESTQSSCDKSIDGGTTWVRTGAPAYPPRQGSDDGVPGICIGATGHGVTGPDGTVYLPRGWCGDPYLAISHDEGLTWEQVRISNKLGMADGAGRLDHDAAVGVDAKGNVYYAWTAQDFKPYLAVSRDGGKTWSKPVMFGPPGVLEATLIAIDVTKPGHVALAFIGSRSDKDFGKGLYDGYMLETTNALSRDPLFYATTVNDPHDPIESNCSTGSCRVEREFIDVSIGPDGTPWAAFVDGCFEESCDHQGAFLGIGHGIVGHLVGGPRL